MITIREALPFWFAGPETRKLAAAAEAFWARMEAWLYEAARQADIHACSAEALTLHAADRGVVRLPGEPEALWRSRVVHALTTAVESGSLAGLEEILATYGVTGASVLERQPGSDWDQVEIRLDASALGGADTGLLDRIFHEWGRVCRRYVIAHIEPAVCGWASSMTDELQHVEVAA